VIRCRAEGLDDGLEAPGHVDAVVGIADGGVELDQVVPLGAHRRLDFTHPGADRGRVHKPVQRSRLMSDLPAQRSCVHRRVPQANQLIVQLEHGQRGAGHLE